MQKLVHVAEVAGEGLPKLMGQVVTLICDTYIYTGKLIGVNEDCVLLAEPSIVYETGPFNTPTWKDAQRLPNEMYVMKRKIESFGLVK